MNPTHEITELLQAWRQGDSEALAKLIPLVDRELKKMAHAYMRKERPGHILQTTALVDEALIRLIRAEKINWDNRKQFYALIARRMRQVMVEDARKLITKGGTRVAQVDVTEADNLTVEASKELLRLHQALTKLTTLDARKANVIELRYFGGFTFDEIAKLLEVSKSTVEREWKFARTWLRREIDGGDFPGIESRPGVMGEVPCITRTRIPVWLLEQARRLGTSEADLLRDYPTLTVQDLSNAWNFVRSHRAEIDAQIEANEKDDD